MSEAGAATVVRAAKTARIATSLVFAMHATVFAAWTPHIPLVKQRLGMDEGMLGLALLGGPVGSLLAILLVGRLVARWGSRPVMLVSAVGYGLSSGALGLAGSPFALAAALALWGAFQGALDVAMNAQAALVERELGRPVMSSFHAWWSAGGGAGAGIGVLAVAAGIDLATQMVVLGLLTAVANVCMARLLRDTDRGEPGDGHHGRTSTALRDVRLLALGAVMLAAVVCEGAAADWGPLYFRETLGTSPALAGMSYMVFAMAMFLGRAMGDRWIAKYGGRAVVGTLSGLGAVVMLAALLLANPVAALIGFFVLGLGLSCTVPVVFSAAAALPGRQAGQAIAAVAAVGWPGFLIGPPAIGGLAHATSLSLSLIMLPLLCVITAVSARFVLGRRSKGL